MFFYNVLLDDNWQIKHSILLHTTLTLNEKRPNSEDIFLLLFNIYLTFEHIISEKNRDISKIIPTFSLTFFANIFLSSHPAV